VPGAARAISRICAAQRAAHAARRQPLAAGGGYGPSTGALRIQAFIGSTSTNFVAPHLTAIHLSITFDRIVSPSHRSQLMHRYSAMTRWTAFVCPLIGAEKELSI
jgi:hypothetical protein